MGHTDGRYTRLTFFEVDPNPCFSGILILSATNPGKHKQSRSLDNPVLPACPHLPPSCVNIYHPVAANSQIRFKMRRMKSTFRTPPLDDLARFCQRVKDAFSRASNIDLLHGLIVHCVRGLTRDGVRGE